MAGERFADRRRRDGAAAQCQHLGARGGSPVLEQLDRDPLLGLPEGVLAVLGEDPVDRLAEPVLDLVVDID
jgi:hypothetical protein